MTRKESEMSEPVQGINITDVCCPICRGGLVIELSRTRLFTLKDIMDGLPATGEEYTDPDGPQIDVTSIVCTGCDEEWESVEELVLNITMGITPDDEEEDECGLMK